MVEIQFESWPKTPRFFKECMIVTEKIDGINAAIGIVGPFQFGEHVDGYDTAATMAFGPAGEDGLPDQEYLVYAQSWDRLIKPVSVSGVEASDDYGFAEWVWANSALLVSILGPGLHFGEWWGAGIGRSYGQTRRYFSLFNTSRWKHLGIPEARSEIGVPDELRVVPVLAACQIDTAEINAAMGHLLAEGSHAAPGFRNPEGICIYLPAARRTFKVTYEGDRHKSELAPMEVAA